MQQALAFTIVESSQVGQARREANAFAVSLGFDETRQGVLALIITEVANNLVRHATEGELFLRMLEANGSLGIEMTAVDKGPGITSISQCMQDGYSTAGTAGNGMGAIARLSDRFEIYSIRGEGTVLVSQLWAKTAMPSSAQMECGVINRPKPGQEVCGDSWGVEHRPGRSLFFLADGLGHGPDAAIASLEAVRAFRKNVARRPKETLEAVHSAIHGTRGVAAALAEIDFEKQQVCFTGIGNIAGTIYTPGQSQSMVSHNGIVGHQVRKVQEFVYPWTPQALLILHSDGLSQRWLLDRYTGLTVRSPELIAGVLYRDFQRQSDDATVLVARQRRDS
ncbi:MAG: serine/threonine protein kinase [Chthonomonadales bacterium]|nr:serine/threonine protein kinase [Chthonomonadales bacterium]